MKTKKYYLILIIVSGILCLPALGEIKEPDDNYREVDYRSTLLGRSNPALTGIEQLAVVIIHPDAEPDKNVLVWKEFEADLAEKVIEKLSKAGIKISAGVAGDILNIVELRIDIDTLKLEDSRGYVFYVLASLSRTVCLAEEHKLLFKADVWNAEPVMQVALAQSVPDKVTKTVLEQVEAFIHAYHLATNSKDTESTKSDNVSTTSQKRVRPVVKPVIAEHRFVASKNSKVFHKLDCSSAGRIKTSNRVFFSSRDKAIQTGRRPCKLCKP